MPREFTCDGPNASPTLNWTEPPARTKSFALSVDEPDAPPEPRIHWVIYDVPASSRQVPEALPQREDLRDGSRQGVNDFGKPGYSGPCPPLEESHRYLFRLYALDTNLNLRPTKKELDQAIQSHVLGQAELIGRYHRQPR